ncbi:hypothetical protein SCP_1701870 [Sparassis crispa]|uniref:Uncharacterized protein n=1 Tax=Sparassis crispa TaxID=139825 RepID=A0A401H647_9APHY|nr:hypothetical protein SCP_1701870 [Sparassis crispa]GBE89861.1 hypothetical protein SCP_1701870 [Sparassis crispa]
MTRTKAPKVKMNVEVLGAPTSPKRRHLGKASAVVTPLKALRKAKDAGKKQYKHATSTHISYEQTVAHMRKWAAQYEPSEGQAVDISHGDSTSEGALVVDPEFREAFSTCPWHTDISSMKVKTTD